MTLKKNDKYVLGAGINGLVFAAYNPEYQVIGKRIGGDFVAQSATVLMQRNKWTEKLLLDLGVPHSVKTYHVKFYDRGEEVSVTMSGLSERLAAKKSCGMITNASHSVANLNQHVSRLEYDPQLVIDRLVGECRGRIIEDEVCRISEDEIVCRETSYRYDRAVSTIPATSFWELRRLAPPGCVTLRSSPVTFVKDDAGPTPEVGECAVNDSAYYVGDDAPYIRVSQRVPGEWLYEYPGGALFRNGWTFPTGVIVAEKRNVAPPGFFFLGRMACWDPSLRIMDVIRESTEDLDLRFAWERQKWVEARVYDLNEMDLEKVTRDMAMALIGEAAEVLNESNYKTHRPKHPLDRKAIITETVDSVKYSWALSQFHGASAGDWLRAFDAKSKIVEDRL